MGLGEYIGDILEDWFGKPDDAPVPYQPRKSFEDQLAEAEPEELLKYIPTELILIEAMQNGIAPVLRQFDRQEHSVILSKDTVENLVDSVCGLSADFVRLDRYYVAVNEKWLLRACTWLSVDTMLYAKDDGTELTDDELGDCDEFGVSLSGLLEIIDGQLAIGRALGDVGFGYHYFNVFIGEDREMYYLEPQSNTVKKLGDVLRKEGTYVKKIEM